MRTPRKTGPVRVLTGLTQTELVDSYGSIHTERAAVADLQGSPEKIRRNLPILPPHADG
jgi:hypothetical protein